MIFGDNITRSQNTTETEEIDITTMVRSHYLFEASMFVNNYCGLLIIVCGLVGNTLSLIVMLQPHNRGVSCCVFLAALAVTDNLLMLNCFNLSLMSGVLLDSFSHNHCRFCAYSFQVFGVCSSFIITAVTVERYLAVCYPLKSAPWRTTARAKKIICGILVFSVLYNLPYIFTARVNAGLLCTAVGCSSFWCKFWSWSGFALNFVVPSSTLAVLNVLIIRAIRNRDGLITGSTRSLNDDNSKDAQLTAMLLLVTTCFVILTSPQYIRYIIFANSDIYKDVKTFAKLCLLAQCTQKSFFTNSAINFFLYCIAGSRFRKDCATLFCKRGNNQEGRFKTRKESSSVECSESNVQRPVHNKVPS